MKEKMDVPSAIPECARNTARQFISGDVERIQHAIPHYPQRAQLAWQFTSEEIVCQYQSAELGQISNLVRNSSREIVIM